MDEDERNKRIAKTVDKIRAASRPSVGVIFTPAGHGAFSGEVLGQAALSSGVELLANLNLAYGLGHRARTDSEWREAARVFLAAVVAWMRAENCPPELLALPAQLNGYLAALEYGQQPARLTPVACDGGRPAAGFVEVTLPATGCAVVDFLNATQHKPNAGMMEAQIAQAIGWPPKRFRAWRKKFNRGGKGDAARRMYDTARTLANDFQDAHPPDAIVAMLIRNAKIFGV